MVKNLIKLLLVFLLTSFDVLGAEGTNEWIVFFGHFHPLILHLPIGILMLAVAFEFLSAFPRFKPLADATEITLLFGMISAVIAALLGYFLSLNGEYGGEILDWHKWLGIGLAVLSILLYLIKRKNVKPMILKLTMLLMLLLLSATGHYGGMLTHGEDYLTNSLPTDLKSIIGVDNAANEITYNFTNVEEAQVFEDLITPVLTDKCVSCHNANKIKGELRLDTKEGLLKGGENGLILAKTADESEIIKLVHLPKDDERHMPPKGKKQLTEEEILLMEWWVNQGALFDTKVSQLEKNEDIAAILVAIEEEANRSSHPVYTKIIDEPDEDDLSELQQKGIMVNRVATESPFLEARVLQVPSGFSSLLKKVDEQLVWLNLSRSDCKSSDLDAISGLNNITKLQLQQTAVDDEALKYVAGLEYLEYLNLYGTKISDAGIQNLAALKNLKSLYLWDTQVSEAGIAQLMEVSPDLVINDGVSLNNSDTVRLAKPLIVSDKTIFNKSTEVTLSLGFEGVEIYYSLDGSTPSRNTKKYSGPISINESCQLKAVAVREGWADSHVASADFIQVKYIIENITLKNEPSPRYAGEGANTLSDGEKGNADFRNGKWLGFEQIDLVAEVDLGEVEQPGEVIVSCLEEIGSYIFFPKSLSVATSLDGNRFTAANNVNLGIPKQSRPNSLKHFSIQLNGSDVRYLRIKVSNVGHCPDWHPGAGDKAWVFVDEIVIN